MSVLGKKSCPEVPGRVPLESQRERMFKCNRKERLSSSARKSTSGITERENESVFL